MTAITRNLPRFVKDLGISIIGQKCYVSIIENLNIEDVDCIKYSLSKGIGVGIVAGGSIMKVPQLLLILRAQSASGLSLTAYILETTSYAITLAYSSRNGFPFSTYGENLFLTIQNIFITLLIVLYNPSSSRQPTTAPNTIGRLIAGILAVLAVGFALFTAPAGVLAAAQLCTLPLSLFSKLPQIAQNYRARSTGQLSTFAVISQIGGCAARLFTTSQEINDPLVAAGFALAFVLNLVVGVQMYAYWGKGVVASYETGAKARDEFPLGGKEISYGREKVDIVVQPQSPTPHQATHQHSQSSAYGRKWARKVD